MNALRIVAVAAVMTVALAAFAAGPGPKQQAAGIDAARLATVIAHDEDHITALNLAEWIRGRKPGLRIIDLRGAKEFAAYHVPRAENLSIESLISTPFRAGETVVLISDPAAQAARAWVLLQTLGHRNIFFLRGGASEWLSDVMNPVLPANASPEATAAFRRASELSRYFGGMPRNAPAVPSPAPPPVPRRGC